MDHAVFIVKFKLSWDH